MIKNIKVLMLAAASLSITSCSDFLDKYPDTAVVADEAMTNLDDCSSIVTGIYSAFKSSALYSGYMTLIPDIQADMAYASTENMGSYAQYYRWEITPTDAEIEAVYSSLYNIIATCNFFLENTEKVKATLTTDAEIEELEKRLGDVYFARALCYAELIRYYCEAYDEDIADEPEMGVSIKLSYSDDSPVKRSTLRESYAQVIADLNEAEKYIPESRTIADSPYFSQAVVNALRARIYMYMGGSEAKGPADEAEKKNLELAVKYASDVINNDAYELSDGTNGSTTVSSDYQAVWQYDSGTEVIWKVAMSSTSLGGSLGRVFLQPISAGTTVYYTPDYVCSEQILGYFLDNDIRSDLFVTYYDNSVGDNVPMIIKYFGNTQLDAGSTPNYVNMPKVFRLSEVYLLRAESYYRLGKEDEANYDLTTLRKKRITGYGSSAATGEGLLEEIQKERVCELFMEGFRLSDIKRWGLNIERTPQQYTMDGPNNNELKVLYGDPKYSLTTWPIPNHEIEATNGVVKGNKSNEL